jgi:hypothetical protein
VRAAVSTAVILRNFDNTTRLPRFLFGGAPSNIGRTGGVHTPDRVGIRPTWGIDCGGHGRAHGRRAARNMDAIAAEIEEVNER